MKLIHLSDLHLGKRVNEFSMLEDQRYILKQILAVVDEQMPQGLILAGDIYDKPVPPGEAVQLFDWFLTELADREISVFAVSGNHDSPERLAFGARLMSGRGVYVSPVYDGKVEQVCLKDEFGRIYIHLMPFLKPLMVRHAFEGQEPKTYEEALKIALEHMKIDTSQRNVLVAHQFVTGASRCESEELLVGGLDNVSAGLFDEFDYVALGHIHSPQKIGRETVRYCGTPLKYSFSEAGQEKSVTLVEVLEKGNCRVTAIPLKPMRDMRIIRGSYLEVTALSFYESSNREDYIQAVLTDEEDIPDGMQKLRVIYPNLMGLEYDNARTRENRMIEGAETVEQKTELELFEEFYELQNNQPMSGEQKEFAKNLIKELKEDGR